ncbi:MAG: glycosyltransferase family 2 protein [Candidatus Omnitrophica bacterium]|nr:glycosyltransferase family 2 protein [Candidatus Omnitrophota bacterium]
MLNNCHCHEKMSLPVSVIVLTYNEERHIERCLNSAYEWADEIFVVDSYSTDNTVGICRRYSENIYQHPFENYAAQRNWAQENLPIRNEWVFHLDADEAVSQELALELRKMFSRPVDCDGFIMARKTMFRNRWIKHGGHYPVYHLRLFKKANGGCEKRLYDQHYVVFSNIGKISGDIVNVINPDLRSWRAQHRRWAALEAQEVLLNSNRPMPPETSPAPMRWRKRLRHKYYKLPLFTRAVVYFIYRYVLRLGFLDGRQGFIFHFWQGLWYRWRIDAEIRALKHK